MGHFAKVLGNKVVNVIVAEEDFFKSFVDNEPGEWIKTSYNTRGGVYYEPDSNIPAQDQSKALRKNYAAIGYTYDVARDAFYAPQPYPSWALNDNTCLWEPPVPYPQEEGDWVWSESQQSWIIFGESK